MINFKLHTYTFLTTFLFFGVFACFQAQAQYTEYEIKGALIYQFAKSVTWPANSFSAPSDRIILGILGDDPFGDVITRITYNRPANGRLWEIRRKTDIKDLEGCHIIFICKSEERKLESIFNYLKKYRNASVLTIGDNIVDFCRLGGIINFSGDKYTFDINNKVAEANKLSIDAKVLKIANVVSYDK